MKPAKRLEQLKPSYIREILAAAKAEDMLSLAGGLPAESLFPISALSDAAANALQKPSAFQYSQTQGVPKLLAKLSELFGCDTKNLLVTSGSQQGLDLIARAYLNPGDTVLVETPCYLGALQVFQLAEANIVPVQQTPYGPDLDQLTKLISRHRPKLFYAVPDFHNPTGVCWPLETRGSVAKLLQQHNVALIEDAPYRALRYEGKTLPAVSSLGDFTSFRLHSFSKTIAPGLRLGAIQGKESLLNPIERCKQAADLHSAVQSQHLLLELLKAVDIEQHIAKVCQEYRHRRDRLATLLKQELGEQLKFDVPEGGMFLWGELKNHSAEQLAERCLKQGVCVVPGSVFYPNPEQTNALRLNFSHSSQEQLKQAVERLKLVLTSAE